MLSAHFRSAVWWSHKSSGQTKGCCSVGRKPEPGSFVGGACGAGTAQHALQLIFSLWAGGRWYLHTTISTIGQKFAVWREPGVALWNSVSIEAAALELLSFTTVSCTNGWLKLSITWARALNTWWWLAACASYGVYGAAAHPSVSVLGVCAPGLSLGFSLHKNPLHSSWAGCVNPWYSWRFVYVAKMVHAFFVSPLLALWRTCLQIKERQRVLSVQLSGFCFCLVLHKYTRLYSCYTSLLSDSFELCTT